MTWFLLGFVPCLPLIYCAWRFLRRSRAERFRGRIAQAVGLLALWTMPAVAAQIVWMLATRSGIRAGDVPAMACFGWWVLLGGASVQAVFEETAKDVSGHRQMTMIDNWNYYFALTAVQTLVLAAIVAWRWQKPRERSDLVVVGAVVLIVGNALMGITWPWWGS